MLQLRPWMRRCCKGKTSCLSVRLGSRSFLSAVFCLLLASVSYAQQSSNNQKWMPIGNDSLRVQQRYIANESSRTISIYVLDAGLDKRLQRLYETLVQQEDSVNYRIVGIAHSKFSGKKRRRDFVPATEDSFFMPKAKFVGAADEFLRIIVDSILPVCDANTDKRILIGHSFGGLFGVYCATRCESPVDEVYVLSPSLWVNAGSFRRYYLSYLSTQFYTLDCSLYFLLLHSQE